MIRIMLAAAALGGSVALAHACPAKNSVEVDRNLTVASIQAPAPMSTAGTATPQPAPAAEQK